MKARRLRARRVAAVLAPVPALLAAASIALTVPAATAAADPVDCSGDDPAAAASLACVDAGVPVPSLDPEWSERFVPPPLPRLRTATVCRPLEAVFYAPSDWFRLAQKLRGDPSTCAEYSISVAPNANDKTRLRNGEATRIRALGSQMHALAEINVQAETGWSSWVAAGNGTWFDAGVEARRRMAAAGFDVDAGDTWAVNELNSAVRQGSGTARANMRDLIRGLYTGDGTGPGVPGVVWTVGVGQGTADLSTYKAALKGWLQDDPWWADMSRYVRFWSQEVFGDARTWAVPGADLGTRRDRMTEYVEHVSLLSEASPPAVADTKAYLRTAEAPLANAAWAFQSAFGYTYVPSEQMQAYVAAQVYALRHAQAGAPWRDGDSFGFAWSPTQCTQVAPCPLGLTQPQYVQQSAAILDRLAASIHASDGPSEDDPGLGACGPDGSWCAADVDGAAFNPAWRILGTWTQPLATNSRATLAEDAPAAIPLLATDADGDTLSYQVVGPPAHGTLAGEGVARTYTPDRDFNGTDSFTFQVSDGFMSSRVATVAITVTPVNDPPTVELGPAGPVDEGAAPVTLTAQATDVDGDPVTATWTTDVGTLVPNGDAATFAADDGPATAHVTVVADDGNGGEGAATVGVEVRNVAPTASAAAGAHGPWGLPVGLAGSATDPSAADAPGLVASWDFGDGSPTKPGFDVTHTYAEPGTYTATLTVADKDGGAGTDTATVTVEPRPATVAYAGASGVDASTGEVTVQLRDAGEAASARLAGHAVTVSTGEHACTATSDATGLARCALHSPALPLGPATLTVAFAGDGLYTAASASAPVVLYALPAGGVFVVGDRSAAGILTFWSPQWARVNRLSGGPAPASFKGFADGAEPGDAGWTASPGLEHAPASVPPWMGVLVATRVTRHGATVAGDAARLVVVRVDAYASSLGRGTVVASGSGIAR